MSKRLASILAIVVLLGFGSVQAHHSGAMFDRTKKVTVQGTVVQFQYVQPHSWIDILSTDASGKEQRWSFEAGAPMQMKMVGLTPDVLKVGDKITITGHPLRDGRPAAAFIELTLPNGKVYNTKPQAGSPTGPGALALPPSAVTPAADKNASPK